MRVAERGDGPRAARDDRRAGPRPARLRAAGLRRRRRRCTRAPSPRSSGSARRSCPRASGVLCALGLAAADRRVQLQRTVLGSPHEQAVAGRSPPRPATRLGARGRRDRGRLRLPLPRPVLRADRRRPRPTSPAAHEERYGFREDGRRRSRSSPSASPRACPGPTSSWPPSSRGEPEPAQRATVARRADRGPARRAARRARRSRARRSSRCPRRRSPCPAGWQGDVDETGTLVLRPVDAVDLQVRRRRAARGVRGDGRGRSSAPRTRRTSRSAATARPRCSTPQGRMVMQAEHIPVHLGAMPAAVAAVLDEDHEPGRSWILNDPFAGGTHLPDITVVTPVFARPGGGGCSASRPAARAPRRRRRAACPARCPPTRRTLDEEGVVIAPQRAHARARRGARRPDAPAAASAAPTCARSSPRTPPARAGWSELAARIGAGALRGGDRRRSSTTPSGAPAPSSRAMDDGAREAADVLEAARRRPRAAAARRGARRRARPRLHRQRRRSTTATSTARWRSRGRRACSRCACSPTPTSRRAPGAERPLTVIAPEGTLLNARSPAAVAGGNVETSSRVADLVLRAFGRALGQGTMNNLTLGNDALHLLRDARRRPGRLPGRRRAERRARRDEQHAQHAGRGARARVPAARRPSTRCAAARAARARTAAATASSARSRRSRR